MNVGTGSGVLKNGSPLFAVTEYNTNPKELQGTVREYSVKNRILFEVTTSLLPPLCAIISTVVNGTPYASRKQEDKP